MTHDTISLSGVLAMWILGKPYNPLQKRESTGASFLYDYIENLNISTEILMNEKLPNQF